MAGFVDNAKKRASSSITKLSRDGRDLVSTRLADGATYAAVIAELKARTGETISRSALSRWRVTDYEPTRQRIEAARSTATELAGLLKDATPLEEKFEDIGQGMFDIMLARVLELKGADISKLSREARMFQQVRLAIERQKHDEERLKIDSERLGMERRELDQRLSDFEAKRAKAGELINGVIAQKEFPPEMVEKVKDFFGIA